MQEFVVVYADPVGIATNEVLIVNKDRPPWQAGRRNLVGGKIEPGESPESAAIRELKEESGLTMMPETYPEVVGRITGSWGIVHVVKIAVKDMWLRPDKLETEKVEWIKWHILREDPLLIPNLRVVIPLIKTGLQGWVIADEGPSWAVETHTFAITVQGHKENKND